MRQFFFNLGVLTLSVCLACGSSGLRVVGIQLGKSLNPDSTVADHTTSFTPGDTIYISVRTAGVGSGTIGVRWMYRGRLLDEPQKKVSYRDVADTDFSLKSVAGFPPGDYSAEVFLDGRPVGTRTFLVNAP